MQPAAYKVRLDDVNDVTVWTADDFFPPQAASSANVDLAGTAGETMTAGEVAYLSDGSDSKNAGQWYLADADFTYASVTPQVAVVVADVTAAATGLFRTNGKITGLSGLTPGALYYVSETAGELTATRPGNARFIGQAESTTVLVVATVPPAGSVDVLEVQCFS
jgi:hypothetical protein